MTPNPAVLVAGLRTDAESGGALEGWVRSLGFETRFTTNAYEARSWLGQEDYAASFVDCDLGLGEGEAVWRTLRPAVARRTVLLARDRRRDLWFEALRSGVATVLPLPLHESMVLAAIEAVTGRSGAGPRTHTY
jgi:DNA-binding response OmpR family regulator